MTEKLDDFLDALQLRIDEETRESYGQVAFERWREPLYMGIMENPDGCARITGSCGDTMQMFLRFDGEKVGEASFFSDGCGCSVVCGSFAAELALGKTPDELTAIAGESILELTGNLPEEERHCAFLAAETLQAALDDYMKRNLKKKTLA